MSRLLEVGAVSGGAALVASALAAPLVYRLLVRLNSRQTIASYVPEHAEKQGTPTMGGIIVLVGLAVGCLVADAEQTWRWLVLAAGFALVGFLDDYVIPKLKPGSRGLSWRIKLVLELLAALSLCLSSGWTSLPLCCWFVFCVLFFANAYNFSDGMDGLAGSLGVLLCLGFAFIGRYREGGEPIVLAAMCTAFIPFLFLNAPPAKVFMGDVGALPFGAVLGGVFASLSVHAGHAGHFRPTPELAGFMLDPRAFVALLLMSLVMLAELLPVPLQIASVKLRKGKRLFPFRTPVHHGMQHAGWPESKVVWTLILTQVVCILLGLATLAFHGAHGVVR